MRRTWTLMLLATLAAVVVGTHVTSEPDSAGAAPADRRGPDMGPSGRPDRATGKPGPTTRPKPRPGSPQGPRPDGSRYRRRSLSDEQEKEVLEYLKTKRPEIYKQVLADREKDPRRYRWTLRSMWFFISRLKHLPEKVGRAEETRQVTHLQMWRLAIQLHGTKDAAARAELERQMLELADDNFAAEQIVREYRLTELAEQIKRIKAELKERAQDRKVIVREKVERMKQGAAHYARDRERGPRTRPSGGRKGPEPGGKGRGPRPPE
jgi:hypothetical protein